MGYYTQHELQVINGPNELIEDLIGECSEAGYSLEPNGDCAGESKWYNHREDLICFSRKHQDVIFKLSGEGEEVGDLWHEYYKNGKVQVCKAEVVYPKFDINLLN